MSGGITGVHTADTNGHVSIINCYSRGDITGQHNGGVCGSNTGSSGGTVILTNVYASGKIDHDNAGGLIGRISDDANEVSITMSVYNGDTGDMIGAGSNNVHKNKKNSGDLGDISGTVYCYNHVNIQCWDTHTVWQALGDDFPTLQGMPTAPFCHTNSSTIHITRCKGNKDVHTSIDRLCKQQ